MKEFTSDLREFAAKLNADENEYDWSLQVALKHAAATIDQQAASLAKCREALEFYANEDNWEGRDVAKLTHSEYEPSAVATDEGARARTALEQTP